MALQGILAKAGTALAAYPWTVAVQAFALADAMLDAASPDSGEEIA